MPPSSTPLQPSGSPSAAALESLADELDDRLADADRALREGYPGERAGRQPVHTVYVPADRYSERPRTAAGALPPWPPSTPTRTGFRAVLRQGRDRSRGARSRQAGRPSRSRTCASTSRTATATGPTTRRTRPPARAARALRCSLGRGDGGAVPRHPVQELRGARRAGAGLRTLALFLERAGRVPARCPRASWSPCRR